MTQFNEQFLGFVNGGTYGLAMENAERILKKQLEEQEAQSDTLTTYYEDGSICVSGS